MPTTARIVSLTSSGGLANTGYSTMIPDIRQYFAHMDGGGMGGWGGGGAPALRQRTLKYQAASRHAASAGALWVFRGVTSDPWTSGYSAPSKGVGGG